MPSSGDTEVFIPEQASVITVPVRCLPSSITRKMSMCLVHSTCPATFISPVELRNKGTTETPRPLTPGQVLLPVVTSNQKAFRILQKFLHSGENSLQFPDETSPAGSKFSRRSHSIVLFDKQIFLVVTKAKACDWSLKKRNPTPYECEAPPLDSPVTTSSQQDGGSDITDGRNKEGTCGAEDDGKCAEKQGGDGLMECEEQDDDDDDELTDRRRSEDAAEEHGECSEASEERVRSDPLRNDVSTNTPKQIKMEEKRGVCTAVEEAQGSPANADERTDEDSATETRLCAQSQTGNEQSSSFHLESSVSEYQRSSAKPKCCKRINFPAAQSPSDVNDRQDKIEVKGQIGELDGEVTDTNDGDRVLRDAAEVANGDVDDPKMNSGDQSSSCESDVEIVNVTDGSGSAGVRSSASKVENFLEKCENLKRIINDYVHTQGSPFTRLKRDVAMETGANRDVAKGEFKVETNSEPICQAKNSNRDVEIIEVVDDDDDDDEEILMNGNEVNGNFPAFESPAQIKTGDAEKSSDKANAHKCDVEITDSSESRRDGAECQNLLEKIESRKRRVSDGNDETRAKAVTPAPMIQTEDPSPKRLKPANVQSAAEDLASSRSSEEPNPSIAPGEESGSLLDCDGEDAFMVHDNRFSPASFTDDPGPDVASSQSSGCFSELQISNVVSLTAPVELPESRASDSGVSDPSTHDEEVSHDLDYKVLKCEENINQIRAKLRGMEEKLDTLNC